MEEKKDYIPVQVADRVETKISKLAEQVEKRVLENAYNVEKSIKQKSDSAEKLAQNGLHLFERLILRLLEVRPKEIKQKRIK